VATRATVVSETERMMKSEAETMSVPGRDSDGELKGRCKANGGWLEEVT
jgi:hypothetical protein